MPPPTAARPAAALAVAASSSTAQQRPTRASSAPAGATRAAATGQASAKVNVVSDSLAFTPSSQFLYSAGLNRWCGCYSRCNVTVFHRHIEFSKREISLSRRLYDPEEHNHFHETCVGCQATTLSSPDLNESLGKHVGYLPKRSRIFGVETTSMCLKFEQHLAYAIIHETWQK